MSQMTAIREGFSPDLLKVLTTKFGVVDEMEIPATEEEAVIAMGKVNVNFNNQILVPLSGLPIVELILKNAQLNETVIGLLYSSLEVVNAGDGKLVMVMPSEGGVYVGGINNVKVQAEGATAIRVRTETGTMDLTQDAEHDHIWSSEYPLREMGTHTIEVSGEFEDGSTDSMTVTFQVEFWDTSPTDGDTLPSGTLDIVLHGGEGDIVSVSVSGVAEHPLELVYDAASGAWKGTLDLAAATYQAVFTVATEAADTAERLITFVLE